MPARVYGDLGRPERHCWLRWNVTLAAVLIADPGQNAAG